MLTDKDYDDWAQKLGKDSRFLVSSRVIRHIRNSRQQKYQDLSFEDFKRVIIHDAFEAIQQIKRSNTPLIVEVINRLSKEVRGLSTSQVTVGIVEKKIGNVLGGIDKLGLRLSIKHFAVRMTEEQLAEIVADIPDSKEINEN